MKLMHLSDLHLGKRVHDQSMLDDQRHILRTVTELAGEHRPDAVLIAGDIYDKAVPSAEAVELFDDFLVALAAAVPHIFLISGNHDSPERIAFGGRLLDARGIHISPVYAPGAAPITLTDEYGPVDIHLLPFIKPVHVRRFFPDAEIGSYTEAIAAAIDALPIDPAHRNVLVTHQFVTGAATCQSEEHTVGGTDNVDATVFDPFVYVALGHLHGPQSVTRPGIRYCGSPLKYSFSEAGQEKNVTLVTLHAEGLDSIQTLPLPPRRDMRRLRGSFRALIAGETDGHRPADDYLHITLTDEADVPEAIGRLRSVYPNLLLLDYDNSRTRSQGAHPGEAVPEKNPLELFEELYERMNGQRMSPSQRELVLQLLEEEEADV